MSTNALHLKLLNAVQAFNNGDLKKSEKLLEQYIKKVPNEFDPLHLMAVIYARNSNHLNAIKFYKSALNINPDDAQALSNFATSLNAIGRHQESLDIQKKAIDIEPNNFEFWYNAGNILCDMRRFKESFYFYEKALILNPYSYETLNNFGKALYDLNQFSESIDCYNQALQLNPNFIDCLINKGVSLKELKKSKEALDCFEKVLSLSPSFAEAHSNKGIALSMLKKFDDAIICFDQALRLKPNYAEAWSNKGIILDNAYKKLDDALYHHNQAISLNPSYAEGWANKAATLKKLNRYYEALLCYGKVIAINPDFEWIHGNFLHTKMKLCIWSNFDQEIKNLISDIKSTKKVSEPFVPLFLADDPLIHKNCAEIYIKKNYPFNSSLGPIARISNHKKIKLGYFSADFGMHAVSALAAELFELHDKNSFELIAFSFTPSDQSPMGLRISKSFDQFIDVNNFLDVEVAQITRKMEIDIAIDLGGFTGENRTGPFSYRMAPIQVNYLGYPGTMGTTYYDYIVADQTLIPVNSQQYFSEKVVYLPHSYQPNDRNRVISKDKLPRHDLGLPDNSFVFCCFNNNYKILPSTYASWMKILKSVEGSVLWLLQDDPLGANNLKDMAKKYGVADDRIIFANRISPPIHLARHSEADLFIDTFPYNAHTTASDALWAGLPLLTRVGESFASRVAASLLTAIDLPELITYSQIEYEELAIELALNAQKLTAIKNKLDRNRLIAPLFNTPLFTKHLESAYFKMHERYQMGLEPNHIYI